MEGGALRGGETVKRKKAEKMLRALKALQGACGRRGRCGGCVFCAKGMPAVCLLEHVPEFWDLRTVEKRLLQTKEKAKGNTDGEG